MTKFEKLLVASALGAAALASASAAGAATYLFNVTDASGVVLSGDFTTTTPTFASSYGSGEAVTTLSAKLKAGAAGFSRTGAATLVANPGGQTHGSASGSFIYDDLYDGSTGHDISTGFDNGGLLFTVGGMEFNLFSNGAGAPYTLYEQFTGGGPGFSEPAAFSAVAAPEPTAWALMLVGFGALGAAIRGRRAYQAA